MDKSLIKETEKELCNYFKSEKTVSRLTSKIELLEQQIIDIRTRIRNTDISIPEQSLGASYSESVQTSRSNMGYAESQAVRIIEQMEIELTDKQEEVFLLEKLIRKKKVDAMDMEQKLRHLDPDAVKVLTLSYSQKIVDWKIGVEMNIAQTTATRWRHKALKEVAEQELRLSSY